MVAIAASLGCGSDAAPGAQATASGAGGTTAGAAAGAGAGTGAAGGTVSAGSSGAPTAGTAAAGGGAAGGSGGAADAGSAGAAGATADAGSADAGQAGDGGATTGPLVCPTEVPEDGSPCTGSGKCFHDDGTTGTIFECYYGTWYILATGSPTGVNGCPAPDDPNFDFDCAASPPRCVYEPNTVCNCLTPSTGSCSGVAPIGPPPAPVWGCRTVDLTPCYLGPQQGAPCPEVGLRCDPVCCGWAWSCTEAGWDGQNIECPP